MTNEERAIAIQTVCTLNDDCSTCVIGDNICRLLFEHRIPEEETVEKLEELIERNEKCSCNSCK